MAENRLTLPQQLIIGLALFAVFFPSFHAVLGSTGAILINGAIIMGAFAIILLARPQFYSLSFGERRFIIGFLVLMLIMALHISTAMIQGMLINGSKLISRDVFELHRPVLYFLVFLLPFIFFRNEHSLNRFNVLLKLILIGLIILSINHFLAIVEPISALYTKATNISSRRLSTPFQNPYDFGYFVALLIFFYIGKLLFVGNRYFWTVTLLFLLVLATQSRSIAGALLIVTVLLVPLLVYFLYRERLFSLYLPTVTVKIALLVVMMIVLLVVGYTYIATNFPYMVEALEKILAGREINSLNIREQQMTFTLQQAQQPLIFLFGNGPSKDVMELVESIYTYYLFRYGATGLVLYFILPLSVAISMTYLTLRKNIKAPSSLCFLIPFALLFWFLMTPIATLGNNLPEQARLSFFYYFALGAAVRLYYLPKDKCKKC